METQGGGGDALGSGAVVSAQQEQQQLVPDAYMVPETAVREGNVSSMKRRMQSGGPAQPQVGSMTMQVTQTRRTIFPGATGISIMRAVGHDVQYQHPGEMLQLHKAQACITFSCGNTLEASALVFARIASIVRRIVATVSHPHCCILWRRPAT